MQNGTLAVAVIVIAFDSGVAQEQAMVGPVRTSLSPRRRRVQSLCHGTGKAYRRSYWQVHI